MCKLKKYHNTSNTKIDKCMKNLIEVLNSFGVITLACCCGHNKYNMSIVIEENKEVVELLSQKTIPRTRNFYNKDKQGYYYIPETRM